MSSTSPQPIVFAWIIRHPASAITVGAVVGSLMYGGFVATSQWLWISRIMKHPINLMSLVAFTVAILLLVQRWLRVRSEMRSSARLTPQGETLLLFEDALTMRQQRDSYSEEDRRSATMQILGAGLNQARAHWSANEVADAVNNQTAIVQAKADSEYSLIRYLAWAIPSIGFIGTVLGIGQAMGTLSGEVDDIMTAAATHLATAFDTTFVALVLSLILMLVMYHVQGREDRVLSDVQEGVMQGFVLRMYTESTSHVEVRGKVG